MPLKIIRNDITKIECDAIVNAANSTLLGGGGVDGAIHKAAGNGLVDECRTLGGCEVGQAKITKGYNLPCKYVIHTVGPKWSDGKHAERELLESCYRESLRLAKENACESVAFPLISSGVYGYPKDEALKVAIDVISGFLLSEDMLVYIVVFDRASYQISERLFADITSYIDEKYVQAHFEFNLTRRDRAGESAVLAQTRVLPAEDVSCNVNAPAPSEKNLSVDEALKAADESFSQMLLRRIDESGMTDAECYKRANIDRKLFSKIRNDINYKPSKATVLAFAIALEFDLEETRELLMKAGFALSHSYKFDIIVEYFIKIKNYNVFEINEALFEFDQNLLGV
ncbi:MAG: O-acetyl-ADP-ribose deacetylase [Clostridiales bacterium]|nr:O-acetyl-ADP-ribose deacetylase [Clostridiales bacterium]